MKWVKIYEDYKYEIIWIQKVCDHWGIRNWSLNSNREVDVNGDVNLNFGNLIKLPLKFGEIGGNFYCSRNKLTTLEGAPRIVRGNFSCHNNQLTSLWGSPKTVTGIFDCENNQIISFEGAPMYVDCNFYCEGNPIYPIWALFRDWSKVEFLNDCDPIQDRNIIMVRLNYFLTEIGKGECGKNIIERLKECGYKIIY